MNILDKMLAAGAAGVTKEMPRTKSRMVFTIATAALALAVLRGAPAAAENESALKVPGGLAFSDFKGYENWGVVAVHHSEDLIKAIVANPVAIEAYRAGTPGNGKAFPDGSKLAKIEWKKAASTLPGDVTVPGNNYAAEIMVKDSKRFADSGGWGYAAFVPDVASGRYRPAGLDHVPPQANDAKCGFACHNALVKGKDYVFTGYAKRP